MKHTRRAIIDVGTNSIKLLVADVLGREVRPVWEDSKQTRLGSGFYEAQRLQPEAVARTAQAVAFFAEKAKEEKAATLRVIATSAARDAVNPSELTSAIEQASGLKVEIISGQQEADWVFRGVTSDPELARQPLLLLDVGGGSTELILGHGERKFFSHSFPLGTVRLMEEIVHSDPPKPQELAACRQWLRDFLGKEVRPKLNPLLRGEEKSNSAERGADGLDPGRVKLVGAGGTATILARMEGRLEKFDREQIEATRLSREHVKAHVKHLWSLPLEARRQIVGLPRKRADVILPGAAIYEAVMEQFDFTELRVSTRGLRFAAVMDAA